MGLATVLISGCFAQSTITTLAGIDWVFPGDGKPALSAPLGQVYGIAVDRIGNVYFSDLQNARVMRVAPTGILSVVAGNGVYGFSGDGGLAVRASLQLNVRGLAVDSVGNLFIADAGNFRVRKVDTGGVITTFAGNGRDGFSGDGGPAINASLSAGMLGLAVDGVGNLYIADFRNFRVRRVTAQGTITTFAGTGQLGFSGDGGQAINAQLAGPSALAFDTTGVLYVSDTGNRRVRRIDTQGIITTAAGNGDFAFRGDGCPASAASFLTLRGLAFGADGSLYICDFGDNRIRKVGPDGVITTVAGMGTLGFAGDGGPATSASLWGPQEITVTSDGRFLFTEFFNSRVRSVTGGVISTYAGNGNYYYTGDGGPAANANLRSTGLSISQGGSLYLTGSLASRVRKIDPFGTIDVVAGSNRPGFAGDGGPAINASLAQSSATVTDANGNLYIADTANNRIRKVTATGTISTIAGTGSAGVAGDGGPAVQAAFNFPQGLAIDPAGNIYVSDAVNRRIRKIAADGIITTVAGTGSSALAFPAGLAIDSRGNLFIADSNGNRVAKLASDGAVSTVAGTGQVGFSGDGGAASNAMLSSPSGVGVDLSGNLFIADTGNNRIRQVTPDGLIKTIAGTGQAALSGDGGPPERAGLSAPTAVVTDSRGNLYIGDAGNGRIRYVQFGPPPVIQLSQTGFTFTATPGGGAPPSQSFAVINGGPGQINWTVSTTTTSGGSWLAVTLDRGTSVGGSVSPSITVTANAGNLAPGDYYGLIQVTSPGVPNSPQSITVVLNVLAADRPNGPAVQPTGLIFLGAPNGPNPSGKTILISNLTRQPVQFTGSTSFDQGKAWFTAQPSSGSVTPSGPVTITIQPDLTGLAVGAYTGSLTLSFSDSSVRRIALLLVIGATPIKAVPAQSVGCTATKLLPIFTTLGGSFTAVAGWPTALEATIVDDCGQAMVTGSVIATFSNGDGALPLSSLGDGRWSGTWKARNPAQVTITLSAQTPQPRLQGTTTIAGDLSANPNPPIIASGGVLNAASFSRNDPIAPGSLVSIFGTKLSNATGAADSLPLPNSMNGTTAAIAGREMPLLYTSEGQVNAMLPYGLAASVSHQVIIRRGNTLSLPEPLVIAPTKPAVFTLGASGQGQGIIVGVHADGNQALAEPQTPASVGDAVVIYCAGLGDVQPSVLAGLVTPLSPLSETFVPVTVTIGGVQAQVLFAGLVPTFTGLYQVNAVIPAAAMPGDQVPVVLTVGGQPSPPVTMAIH